MTNLLCIGKGIILANVTLGRASKRILFFVLESATADLNNISAVAGGGSCTAAAFLKVFFIVLYTVGLKATFWNMNSSVWAAQAVRKKKWILVFLSNF